MNSEIDKLSDLLGGQPRRSAPAIWKWIYRGAWALPALFVIFFPLAFANRSIYIDEAWIGQQVHSLINNGYIATSLFRDFPPLDKAILIYHKLTVWAGALSAVPLGWGLYQLRLVSAISGLTLIITLYFFIKSIESRRIAALSCLILLWSPVFWEQMRIFRPEMIMACLGLASFMILYEGYLRQSAALTVLAGAFAGWSGLAHPIGLFFMFSGAIALIVEKEIKLAVILCATACLAFVPYLTGLFIDWRLFYNQLFNNGVMAYKISFNWYSPLLNFLNEHKKIFRGPEIFGLSVLFILSLFYVTKRQYREHKFLWVYFGSFFVLGAIAPLTKASRYMLPLAPFFALIVARTINNFGFSGGGWRRIVDVVFVGWIGVFILYGAFALGYAALGDRTAPKEMDANRLMADKMRKSSVAMAPFDFVFNEIENFTIQSWCGCEKACENNMTPECVEQYAVAHGVDYIIAADPYFEKMKITEDEINRAFRLYTPLFLLPKRDRFLFVRKGKITPSSP
jgi:4-amino-4-deoxy-L-arabinose transferase-like glycosyltransferase